ncbi:MAG: acyl-CoA dehydrogenase family protein [Acidimicrobiia bacterium]|nr:acyl-CoA dehydrogenase family protein [Acidimicrobiia bacterium]
MDLRFSPEEESFRHEARTYLESLLDGPFAEVRARGGPGDEDACVDERRAFEQQLGRDGWTCLGWPERAGGRGLPLSLQVVFHEEYARLGGPGRLGHIGEGLIGPTLVHYGTAEQQQRFLDPIRLGTELWCQGYSEPDAGSDLANIATKARLEGDDWVIDGQKVWTSGAHLSDWCFVLARTDPAAPRHAGISFLLVPMDQRGVTIRPIHQITGGGEFNEVFFDGARTRADLVVGDVDDGWRVAMGLLAFERGASTLAQQFGFTHEFDQVLAAARQRGLTTDPVWRQRLTAMWSRLEIMRWNSLRMLTDADRPELVGPAFIHKLFWAGLHRDLGEAAVDVFGADAVAMSASGRNGQAATATSCADAQRLFLFTRADTIYGGSDEIQRNIIGERALGLPREPRPPVG